jgi:hypothetical protein
MGINTDRIISFTFVLGDARGRGRVLVGLMNPRSIR